MSYEGYVEHLCVKGHLSCFDVHNYSDQDKCEHCESEFVFTHHVDQTNGVEYDEEGNPYPHSVGYPFEEAGFEDQWDEDHYGNKFAKKIILFKTPQGVCGSERR